MANKTITQLDAAQSLNDNMVIAVQDTNTTYKTTLADVKAYCGGGSDNIGIPREVKNGVYQIPTENFTFSLPSDATDVGLFALLRAFYKSTGLTSVDLSSLTTVSGNESFEYAFEYCTALTSVDLSSLTTVSGNSCFDSAFSDCTALTSVDLSSLTTVSGYGSFASVFAHCTSLTTIDFPSLTTVSGGSCFRNAFAYSTSLTDIYFRALTTSSFDTKTNQFYHMMYGTGSTVTHTLHFPSNMESTISGLEEYPLFGGTDGYVVCVFDLPATE